MSTQIEGLSIGRYLIARLQDLGVRHVFGIPGDYVLGFYHELEQSPIDVVGCTREDCAGFAADAYARVNGIGAVCVTYCVGGLSLANSTAGAFAEKSPVVVITGSPGMNERTNNPLLHHRVRDFRTQFEVFDKLCIAAADLYDPRTAFAEIDRVLDAVVRFKRPGYLEIPRDMVHVVPDRPHAFLPPHHVSDPLALAEAVAEAKRLIDAAERPVIVAGVETQRFHLEDLVVQLAESTNIAIASTVLGKSAIRETHPLYIGLYEGALGRAEVAQFVEESDLVLLLGAFMTDINLGIDTAHLDPQRCIYATSEDLRVRHHHYRDVAFPDFLQSLVDAAPNKSVRAIPSSLHPQVEEFVSRGDAPITIRRAMSRLNQLLDDDTLVIADVGDSLFAASELVIRGRSEFLAPAYYTSMGFAVPAALGAEFARPSGRVVAIVGDGAFQMTGAEMSNLVRHGFASVILLMDNGGYGTERFLHPGPFNDIHAWNYAALPQVFGGGTGYIAATEAEFDAALSAAWADRSGVSLIQVKLSEEDASPVLTRLAARMSRRVRGEA